MNHSSALKKKYVRIWRNDDGSLEDVGFSTSDANPRQVAEEFLPAAAGLGLANEEIAKRLERVHVRRHFSAKRERARFELHVHVLFHAHHVHRVDK